MNRIKFLTPFLVLLFIFNNLEVNGQVLKTNKELQKKIREKEQEIRTNEEMLMSGVEGFERTKSRLEKTKQKGKISPEELTKRERILSKVEGRLSLLDQKIKKQKEDLNAFIAENTSKSNTSVKEVTSEITNTSKITKDSVEDSSNSIEERKERLRIARENLERERLEREAAHKLEQEKLAALDKKIKNEEAILEEQRKAAENKILAEKAKKEAEKQKRIQNIEDDIFVSQELLTSGQEGLAKSKERLEKAKLDENMTPDDIARKESIVKRVEERLNKISLEISEKQALINKIKEEE